MLGGSAHRGQKQRTAGDGLHLLELLNGYQVLHYIGHGAPDKLLLARDKDVVIKDGWAYSANIPKKKGTAGFFNRLLKGNRVQGPIVTTQSDHDRAVGTWYPLVAVLKRQIVYALDLPKYGVVGPFGIQGLDDSTISRKMAPVTESYNFQPVKIYNLESRD